MQRCGPTRGVSCEAFPYTVSEFLSARAGDSRESPWERARRGTDQDHRTHVCRPAAGYEAAKRVSRRVGKLGLERARAGVHVEHPRQCDRETLQPWRVTGVDRRAFCTCSTLA